MASTSTEFEAPPELRLTFCPQCDYSFKGLPSTGICPECGRSYDQTVVVLRARPLASSGDPNQYQGELTRGKIFSFASSLLFLAFFFHLGLGATPFGLFYTSMTVMPIAAAVISRLSSVRPGYALVWLSPEGMAQGRTNAPGSLAGQIEIAVRLVMILGFVLWLAIDGMAQPNHRLFSLYVLMPVACVSLIIGYLRYRQRMRVQIPAAAGRPALWPWAQLRSITFERAKDGSYQLSTSSFDWLSTRFPLVNARLAMTDDQATVFRSLLSNWRSREERSIFVPSAAAFGGLLRRVFVRS